MYRGIHNTFQELLKQKLEGVLRILDIPSQFNAPDQHPDCDKMRELILYLAKQGEADPRLGKTKLNKLLFYCDFIAYIDLGHAISGFPYIKLQHGPVPDNKQLEAEMIRANDLSYEEMPVYGYTQRRPIAMRTANMELFSQEELGIIHGVCDVFRTSTGSRISGLSHSFIGWQLAELYERIPYCMALIGDREPSEAEIAYGRRLANEIPDRSQDSPAPP